MEVFEAIGAHAAGKITDEELQRDRGGRLARASAPAAASSPPTRWRWPSRCSASRRCATPASPPSTRARRTPPTAPGELVMDVLARGQRPSDIITRESLENAIAGGRHAAAARPTACCTCWRSPTRPGVELDIDDFDRISSKTPLTCDLSPGGRYVATDLHDGGRRARRRQPPARGRPAARGRADRHRQDDRRAGARRRGDGGPGGRAAALEPAQAHGRPRDPARQPRPRGLRRQARRPRARPPQRPRARVRRRGGARWLAVTTGQIEEGDVDRDPQRGPRRRPRDARDARGHGRAGRRRPRRQRRADHRRALLRRHPRLHGRPRRPRGRPRRPDRGGRARATRSRSTSSGARLDVDLSDEEIAERVAAYEAPDNGESGTGVLAKYAKLVSSAAEGAITR